MSKQPYISIICPIYNSSSFLKKAIDSILNQSFSDWELFLIDDCSTDDSINICKSYNDKRIHLLLNEKNMGQGYCRNKGIDVATGKYITFLDSDDYFGTDYLYNAVGIIEKEKPDLISTNFSYVYRNKENRIRLVNSDEVFNSSGIYEQYLKGAKIHSAPWAKFYKKSILSKVRFPCFRAREDIYFINLVLPQCNKILVSSLFGYYVTVRKGSTENQSGFNVEKLSTIKSAHLALKNCAELYPYLVDASKSYAGHLYFCIINDMIRTNYYKRNLEKFDTLINDYAAFFPFALNKKEKRFGKLLIEKRSIYIFLFKIGVIE